MIFMPYYNNERINQMNSAFTSGFQNNLHLHYYHSCGSYVAHNFLYNHGTAKRTCILHHRTCTFGQSYLVFAGSGQRSNPTGVLNTNCTLVPSCSLSFAGTAADHTWGHLPAVGSSIKRTKSRWSWDFLHGHMRPLSRK